MIQISTSGRPILDRSKQNYLFLHHLPSDLHLPFAKVLQNEIENKKIELFTCYIERNSFIACSLFLCLQKNLSVLHKSTNPNPTLRLQKFLVYFSLVCLPVSRDWQHLIVADLGIRR